MSARRRVDVAGTPPKRASATAPGDAGLGVGVAAEGDGQPHRLHPVVGLQDADQGLGHRSLAGDVEGVARPDRRRGAVEIIAEAVGQLRR